MNRLKKPILLVVLLAILVALILFTQKLMKSKGNSDGERIDFAIEDTTSITKITIEDPLSTTITLVNNEGNWTDSHGQCVAQSNVSYILDAAKFIEFKGYLPKNSQKKFTELMSTQHTKVTFYVNGDYEKTWYIGPPAQDHYGQIMLLETADGKSTEPVMMRIKGVNGIISPRFFADARKWMCTEIFALSPNQIKSVDINHLENPSQSFKIVQNRNRFDVTSRGSKLRVVDTMNVYRYLQAYHKIHFNLANFELNKSECAAMKRSTPFCVLTLKETSGKTTKLKMFRIKTKEPQRDEFGAWVNMDMNVFWCQLPNGSLVKCQYYVFNPILLGNVYFPSLTQ
ncbi:MAG: hypothetical protein EBR91_01470 [Flavobacteriia bacterium]|jgi:hypothetical protein|nr:hypothetical protein [Flavobacteriia bacterium]NBV67010.1 hypothetical protein [Flavobacteriia bacterium]NBV90820.1 hypothetical protein [Flavobacteriia bacterium]NBY40977.1 hypothetical protein [Flavobacteriia bacterium]